MRGFFALSLLLLVLSAGCTTMEPIEMSPAALQQKITEREIVHPGERVKLATSDGRVHRIRVREVDPEAGVIVSSADPIRIDDVLAIETQEISLGKTALLAAGSYTMLWMIAIALSPALIL